MPAERARPSIAVLADLVCGALVLLLGLWAADANDGHIGAAAGLLVVAAAVIAAGARFLPAAALAGIWAVSLLQFGSQAAAFGCALGIAVVGYRTARYGARPTVWAAALSIPVAATVAAVLVYEHPQAFEGERALVDVIRVSRLGLVSGFLAVVGLLAAPFALGVAARLNAQYRHVRAQREIAEARAVAEHDLAQARADQTRLTRDVHDIVGHSLAVIIAQADSARPRATDEPVRTALTQIAAVGRSSLAEVRGVLANTQDDPGSPPAATSDLDELVAGVRAAGNEVHETVVGDAEGLDPQTGSVVYRVLQEMLTNSLKHGAPGGRIDVRRQWTADGLTLSVANAADSARPLANGGMGLPNLRSRLEAIGGTLEVSSGERFVTTAHLPRAGGTR